MTLHKVHRGHKKGFRKHLVAGINQNQVFLILQEPALKISEIVMGQLVSLVLQMVKQMGLNLLKDLKESSKILALILKTEGKN